MSRLCGSVIEEHNNTDISDKRKPIPEEQQTIYDKLRRKAEYNSQYRARKKTLLGTSSANNDNIACDFAQPFTSTGIEHPVAAVSAVSSITDVTPQNDASNNDKKYNKFSL